jgi:hypothetical protein
MEKIKKFWIYEKFLFEKLIGIYYKKRFILYGLE